MADNADAWETFTASLQRAGVLIREASPDDPLDRAEGERYLARLTRWAIGTLVEQADTAHPVFGWESPKIGGDNPDYLYGSVSISGSLEYEVTCRANDAYRIGIGTYAGGLGTSSGLRCTGYLSTEDLREESDGSLRIQVACDERDGNWLPMHADSTSILIRETVLDRRSQRPADFDIVCVADTATVSMPSPDPADLARRVAAAGLTVEAVVAQFLTWTARLAAQPNTLRPLDPDLLEQAQGDRDTRYYNGYFELRDGEALVIDVDPGPCDYWNLQLANHWLESLDFLHLRTHVNNATAERSPDGKARVVVASTDPGAVNWLETGGHGRGCLAMRVVRGIRDPVIATSVQPIDPQ